MEEIFKGLITFIRAAEFKKTVDELSELGGVTLAPEARISVGAEDRVARAVRLNFSGDIFPAGKLVNVCPGDTIRIDIPIEIDGIVIRRVQLKIDVLGRG